jgi:hypothetical protein
MIYEATSANMKELLKAALGQMNGFSKAAAVDNSQIF